MFNENEARKENDSLKDQLRNLEAQGYKNNVLWCVGSGIVAILTALIFYVGGFGDGYKAGLETKDGIDSLDEDETDVADNDFENITSDAEFIDYMNSYKKKEE